MKFDSRGIVTQRITAEFKKFPKIYSSPLLVDSLDSRDTSLARAIDHAVHRRWNSLSTVISHASNRRINALDQQVGATLLVATAQLLLLDKIPDHAVIHNAVEWIKSSGGRPRASGFVNACLRTVTRLRGEKIAAGVVGTSNHFLRGDGSAWELTENVFENDIATQTGFSPKSWKYLVQVHGEKLAINVATNSLVEPPIIVTSLPEQLLPSTVIPHKIQCFGVVPQSANVAEVLALQSHLRVQDPTSTQALSLASSLQPRRILDVCAGRGTKTKQLRAMFPDAYIGATEPNASRRASLEAMAEEYNVHIFLPDSDGPTEPFDLILVDVPCSNSGVFARRPEAKYRYNKASIDSVIELQQSILIEAKEVLQSRGHLLYATCSIESDENECQMNWIKKKHKLTECSQVCTFPSGQPNSDPTEWQDGGYATLLQAP